MGKMIDIYGNLVVGKFAKNVFLSGFVINSLGHLYIVNFSPIQIYKIKGHFEFMMEKDKDLEFKEDVEDWYSTCDPTEYFYPNKDVYFGSISNYQPHGYGIKFLYMVKYLMKYTKCYKKIIGNFREGKLDGECILEMFYLHNKSKFTARVVYEDDEITWINSFMTKNSIYVHNCSVKEGANHMCMILNETDLSVQFYGNSNLDS